MAAGGSWAPPTVARTRFVLVRHGATVHSADRRFSGRNDLALDEVGRAQASALGRRSFGEVAAILSSPLRRAVETAQAIAGPLGLQVRIVDELIETDFGQWEGATFGEILAADPDALRRWRASLDAAPPGGESFAAVAARVDAARRAVMADYGGRSVVVVSHVTPIKLLLGTALDAQESALFRLHLDTASVSIADFHADGNAGVTLVNDTSHLRCDSASRSDEP